MQITIQSVSDLGLTLRAVRRSNKVRLDDLAGMSGVSKQFASDVEHGKSTVQLGLVLKLLSELGIPLTLDIPQTAEVELASLRLTGGLKPLKKRSTQAPARKSVGARPADKD
jgi:transcriptional regulator with XRE-family HTH domain